MFNEMVLIIYHPQLHRPIVLIIKLTFPDKAIKQITLQVKVCSSLIKHQCINQSQSP